MFVDMRNFQMITGIVFEGSCCVDMTLKSIKCIMIIVFVWSASPIIDINSTYEPYYRISSHLDFSQDQHPPHTFRVADALYLPSMSSHCDLNEQRYSTPWQNNP